MNFSTEKVLERRKAESPACQRRNKICKRTGKNQESYSDM